MLFQFDRDLVSRVFVYEKDLVSFQTNMHFVSGRFRGFRVPNQYSAIEPCELEGLRGGHEVEIRNARLLSPEPTLESHGFQLVDDPISMDLMDTEVVRGEYYEHCRKLLKRVTHCLDVRGGSHEYRTGFGGAEGRKAIKPTPNGSAGAYGLGIHADMCAAIERAFDRIVDDRHFESINIWRSTKLDEIIEMTPLAVCDMRSVDPADIVFCDGMNTGNVRQFHKVVSQNLVYSPNQRWYYFPNMTPNEVLLFRQYDTRQEPLNLRAVFHSAVNDPNTAEDSPMRSTIEVRMQAIYEREDNKRERVERFVSQISNRYIDGRETNWWSGPIENYVPPPQYR